MPKLQFKSVVEDFQTIPTVLLECLQYYLSPEGSALLQEIQNYIVVNSLQRIIFVGHSYNYFAAHIPFYFINQHHKTCEIYEIDEFVKFYRPEKDSARTKSVFVFISHSGNSLQIQQGITRLHEGQISPQRIWSITNATSSFLATHTHFTLPSFAGKERVIGTKSYVLGILISFFLARAFLELTIIPQSIEKEIRQLIFEMKFYAQDWEYHVQTLTEFLGIDYEYLYFISKGASLATVYQAAIGCKSYAQTYAEGTNIGLFLHGPYQIVQRNPESFRCVLVVGDESSLEETVRLIRIVSKQLGSGKVMLINNSRALSALARSNKNVWVFEHTTTSPYLAPIFEYIVIQYLLLDLALRKGIVTNRKEVAHHS